MLLAAHTIAELLDEGIENAVDPLVICPKPDTKALADHGGASVDLRLGSWFTAIKARKLPVIRGDKPSREELSQLEAITGKYYVPPNEKFVLHPKSFVLAVTLEWLRIPRNLAAMVSGRSSLGRRGLIVETAPGVHPGFTGCLTLELTNLGEIPIEIQPGMQICQLFLHRLEDAQKSSTKGRFIGQRQPTL